MIEAKKKKRSLSQHPTWNFPGKVRSEITFEDLADEDLHHKFEAMVYLSLPIRPPEATGPSMGSKSSRLSSPEVNLLHCLEQFANHEELAQDDWAYCERTRRCERSSVKMDIWSAPECLIIHLKRFAVDATTGAGAKRGGELLTTTKRSGKTNCQRKSAKISNCKTMNWEIQKGERS